MFGDLMNSRLLGHLEPVCPKMFEAAVRSLKEEIRTNEISKQLTKLQCCVNKME